MKYLLLIVLWLATSDLNGQVCTELGQNPETAFPVCGSATFSQANVPICGSRQIPTPCTAAGSIFQDKNPYWYKFTCFKSGTLGFEITPLNLADDYDWQLFDVTLRNPADVYIDNSLFVACNWSGDGGKTGASASGNSLVVCEGYGRPLYSKMPELTEGHQYLLLISHFTNTQSGYSLSFGGGTGSIIDTTASTLKNASPNCDGRILNVGINKKVSCSSLAADGSDFTISPGNVKIIGASGANCSNAFDMDSLVLTFDNPLPSGAYTISVKKGTDSNTLLDICGTPMAEGISASFTFNLAQPTPFDSITRVGCAPNELEVVFSRPILCNSVAANGSDFSINASSGVTIVSATTTCSNNSSNRIKLKLSGAITRQGIQVLTLVKGSDGNTFVNECQQETAAGATVSFTTSDIVSSAIVYNIRYGCKANTVQFSNNGGNGINRWAWSFNERANSSQQNPQYVYTQYGTQQVKLFVTNGVCTDSSLVSFNLDNELKARFAGPTLLCPQDAGIFKDSSVGKITNWVWDFGNGRTSILKNPPDQNYGTVISSQSYTVKLVVKNDRNCYDTAIKPLQVLNNCFIAVPSAFTPNGDGLNEYLYPTNAFKASNLIFRVYNRYGQLVFESKDHTGKWDGTLKGVPQATGTFVWTLQYTHVDTGQTFSSRGTTVLIR